MNFIIDKNVKVQLLNLMNRGGHYQKAGENVKKFFGDITLKVEKPLENLSTTKHGETRIKNAVKYDLNGFCRLITIQEDNTCLIKFLGDHDSCEAWLNSHKGLNIGIDTENELKDIYISEDLSNPESRLNNASDFSSGKLINKIGDSYKEIIFEGLANKLKKMFNEFDSLVEDDEIIETCELIQDKDKAELLFDTFIQLRAGDVDKARNRILYYRDEIDILNEASKTKIDNIVSNDEYIKFDDMEPEDLKILMDNKSWYEWMLFMHPAQKNVVEMDFTGPARLLGVSGSGKTAIIVKRALRLAKKYPSEKILILTLNRSLAKLIENLVEVLINYQDNKIELREQIKVKSYWDFCRDYLIENAKDDMEKKIYDEFVDKHLDSVEFSWEEFYRCENNNDDANVLFNLHKSLLSRGINSQSYIKQEFDWIRSAFSSSDRNKYLEVEREGRYIPLGKENREDILKGLKCWEEHMKFIGVTDYLGLSQSILKHIDKIRPQYRSILVDEMQDFGTIELLVIRKLCNENENDIFLTGDIAQVVQAKHQKITQAGIKIAGQNYLKITKNYRNSREILAAAYEVFNNNTEHSNFSSEFEILNPEYANFSSPKPFLRKASSITNGFNSSYEYLKDILEINKNEKGCIAICGYSYYEILKIGQELNIPVLDGKMDLSESSIFLSDLENTKGFEFDRMIIINCNEGVVPNPDQPKEEWFRDISRLYVAMTRAKRELIISYNTAVSKIFNKSIEYFTTDNWTDHISINNSEFYEIPLAQKFENISKSNFQYTGKQFLYSYKAIGLSLEAQQKLIDIVNGTNTTDHKKRVLAFKDMSVLKSHLDARIRDIPQLTRIFGPVVFREIEDKLKN